MDSGIEPTPLESGKQLNRRSYQLGYWPDQSIIFIIRQMNFRSVQNQKENCHYNRIPFNLKEIRKKILWVQMQRTYVNEQKPSAIGPVHARRNIIFLEIKSMLQFANACNFIVDQKSLKWPTRAVRLSDGRWKKIPSVSIFNMKLKI